MNSENNDPTLAELTIMIEKSDYEAINKYIGKFSRDTTADDRECATKICDLIDDPEARFLDSLSPMEVIRVYHYLSIAECDPTHNEAINKMYYRHVSTSKKIITYFDQKRYPLTTDEMEETFKDANYEHAVTLMEYGYHDQSEINFLNYLFDRGYLQESDWNRFRYAVSCSNQYINYTNELKHNLAQPQQNDSGDCEDDSDDSNWYHQFCVPRNIIPEERVANHNNENHIEEGEDSNKELVRERIEKLLETQEGVDHLLAILKLNDSAQ